MNIEKASQSANNYMIRLLTAAAKGGDLGAARHLLAAMENMKAATESLRINVNAATQRWKLTQNEMDMIRVSSTFIDAIKAVRERTGLGLKDAKDLCDAYRDYLYRTGVLQAPHKLVLDMHPRI